MILCNSSFNPGLISEMNLSGKKGIHYRFHRRNGLILRTRRKEIVAHSAI